jgi:enoyl-CoA hydratase/carnithine racemase
VTLRLERDGPIGRLLIDRPTKRNAFNQAMWALLPLMVEQIMDEPAIRVLILQSATPGIFCAGADIGELLRHKGDARWRSANQTSINFAQFQLTRANKPTIAFVDGDCVGGGCGLALACDLRVATPRARFGITPAKLGLVYPLHDTKLLVDLIGPGRAKKMLFTGELQTAEEAQSMGLVEQIAENADDVALAIAANSLHSTQEMKKVVRRVLDGQVDDDKASLKIFADAFEHPDFAEGTAAFVEKRKAQFQ